VLGAVLVAMLMAAGEPPRDDTPRLSPRVRRIVLHVLGGPVYGDPARRWLFETPERTLARWAPRFGAHWIVWTDGTIWPRKASADAPGYIPPAAEPADSQWQRRIAREAAPVFSHLHLGNSDSVGVELAHSGRMSDSFPEAQVRSLAWLLRTLMALSADRLTPADIVGHKDCDRRPAYTRASCERPGCPVFVDTTGWPYRRRVDPPETLFAALAAAGLVVPRPDGALDGDLRRAEAVPAGTLPLAAPP
jgi:hypothetical protein